jgi:hypothetical protein
MGPAQQHQKGSLEGIFDVVPVSQQASADTQHHRSVPAHEHLERCFIAVLKEALQQCTVISIRGLGPESNPANMAEEVG